MRTIAASPLVREHLPIMIDAANLTADVQVRNRGTVAGSLAHADPAGDWPAALMALDTEVTITGPGGQRTRSLGGLSSWTPTRPPSHRARWSPRCRSAFRAPPCGGAYVKFEKRAGDFAVASVGVQLELGEDGRCRHTAISLGALGVVPVRASSAEELLHNRRPTDELLREAEHLVRGSARPFEDTRGSIDYKRHLAGVLFRRSFEVAASRAHGEAVRTLHV